MKLSFYQGVRDRTGTTRDFDIVTEIIREGPNGLKAMSLWLQKLVQESPEEYAQAKTELPAVTWSGVFEERKHLVKHSGLIVLDIDNTDVKRLAVEMYEEPSLLFGFISPSGKGMKLVIPVDPVPTNTQEHKAAFQAVHAYFSEKRYAIGELTIDISGSDPNRLCFLAYDPLAIQHATATPIHWQLEKATPPKKRQRFDVFKNITFERHNLEVLDHIPADDYATWISIGLALKNEGFPMHVWDTWSQKSGKYEANGCEKKWESFKQFGGRQIGWGSIVYLAQQNGWTPPPKAPPMKQRVKTWMRRNTNRRLS